jgi:diketogulonate reductase-like aldo/keto reductase
MEILVDHGECRAIGLSDITLDGLLPTYESARINPAVVQVEVHPYLPETEFLEFCKQKDIVFLAFARCRSRILSWRLWKDGNVFFGLPSDVTMQAAVLLKFR